MSRLLWMFFILTLLVIGCSSDEAPKVEEETSETTWDKPMPSLHIHRYEEESSLHHTNFHARLDRFCWVDDIEDTCADPSDPIQLLDGTKPLIVTPEEPLWFHYNNLKDDLPYPDEIAFTLFTSTDETGVDVEVTGGQRDEEIQTPSEPGKYYYLVHMKWNGTEELIGGAHYAFSILVRDES